MPKFTVYYRYSYCGFDRIEAETKEQAKQIAEDKWVNYDYPKEDEDLDCNSFVVHDIEDENGNLYDMEK